jgi:hypothetical protein
VVGVLNLVKVAKVVFQGERMLRKLSINAKKVLELSQVFNFKLGCFCYKHNCTA